MKVLVLGGTRFIGKAVVRRLAELGDEVIVVSRRPGQSPEGVRFEIGERSSGLERLRGSVFDACLDFICYTAEDIAPVFDNIDPGHYIMVSSSWLPRLDVSPGKAPPILPITRKYLEGKAAAEVEIARIRNSGKPASIVRLPIIFGHDDHTGRCQFYLDRMSDDRGLLLVNGGQNLAQIAWSEDVSNVICLSLRAGLAEINLLWEAIPDAGTPVKSILAEMAGDRATQLLDVSKEFLLQRLPQYLDLEPLWRESSVPISDHNVFAVLGIQPTIRRSWLSTMGDTVAKGRDWPTRATETALIEEMTHS